MAATNFRTEKLLKELEALFQYRLDNFEDLKYFALSENKDQVKFFSGKGRGLRRSISRLLIAFDLTGTELYEKNDKFFELEYLAEREAELSQLNE
ncbi:hypothetical protein [Paenibacillus polymyxa]|uniref:hypothetical protein n=1 Tax=Paenibacillus polymyxa TaxID=1406 RepID=UPI000F872B51|nr:hypothetical protein [Paenibacillus polymyxa]QDA30301.1 hypothetical protein FGY93_25630 [Paenibacillus polymyxa]RTZ29760.1 hypothetical protein EJ573_24840 [Paenibacillus polymyxa]